MRPNPIMIPALALIILFSSGCKKSSSNTPANKSGTPTGTSWSWTGAAPLSAKIDGVPYQATTTLYSAGIGGDDSAFFFFANNASDTTFEVIFDKIPTANAVYSFDGSDSSASVSFEVGSGTTSIGYSLQPRTGKIKVIAITDTTIEGQFYGNLVDDKGFTTSHKITNGYFKVHRY